MAPDLTLKTFSTVELCSLIPGITPRQIQWWVEQDVIPVARVGWARQNLVLFRKLQLMVDRQRRVERLKRTSEEEERAYSTPLVEAFNRAAQSYPSVEIDPDVMAGAPCMKGTRIPVYMVLDAIEYYGSLEGGVKSYPRLTMAQIKDAIGFAKLVVECPLVDEAQTARAAT